MKKQGKSLGLTKDAGWQFGLRKTFSFSQQYLRNFMFSDAGLKSWLGELNEKLEIKKEYKTREGVEGFISLLIPYSHIRMKWKKKNWENISSLQVRVMGNHEKATINFHQDNLLNDNQREEMKLYWNQKMAQIEKALKSKI